MAVPTSGLLEKAPGGLPLVRDFGLNTAKAANFSGFTVDTSGNTVTPGTSANAGTTTVKSATATPASAGAVAAGAPITIFSDGPSIYVTSDVPSFSAVKGSLCINTGGSSTSTRLYVNNGTTNWIAITTAS